MGKVTSGLKRATMEIIVLSLLKEGDKYGNQMCKEISERSQGLLKVQMGSLYPVLYRLTDNGYLTDRKVKVGVHQSIVYYHLDTPGMELLEELKAEYDSVMKGIRLVLDEDTPGGKE